MAELGIALHPLQDIVAHGSFGKRTSGEIWAYHNFYSPQWLYDSDVPNLPGFWMAWLVDNKDYDSTGNDGIPDDSAMHYIWDMGVIVADWATFKHGQQRLNKTKADTHKALEDYRKHLEEKAGCKCKTYFLGVGMIPLSDNEM